MSRQRSTDSSCHSVSNHDTKVTVKSLCECYILCRDWAEKAEAGDSESTASSRQPEQSCTIYTEMKRTLIIFLLGVVASCIAQTSRDAQKAALVALYNSTNGPLWKDNTNWLSDTVDYCQWNPVQCDGNQNIYFIDLGGNNLNGTIPSNIGDLGSSLTGLGLGDNPLLHGTIPLSIANLTGLGTLNLRGCNLNGSVPSIFGRLTSLNSLQLQGNQLAGSIPDDFCNAISLVEAFVFNNQFSGPIPSCIGNLTKMVKFDCPGNQFSGPLPSSIGLLTQLQQLNIPNQKINGIIPDSICNMISLTLISLPGNQLTGSLPSCLGRLTNLVRIELQANQLTGSLPSSISQCTSLTGLIFFANFMSGALVNMVELQLQGNQLNGSIAWMSSMTNLRSVYMGGNDFTGPIPTLNAVSLTTLELQDNQLSGVMPDLSNCTSLNHFFWDNNMISGILPHWLLKIATISGIHTWIRGIDMNSTESVSWSNCGLGGNYFPCPIQPQLINKCGTGTSCLDTSSPQFPNFTPTADFAFNLGQIASQLIPTLSLNFEAGLYPGFNYDSPNGTLTLVSSSGLIQFNGPLFFNVKNLIIKGPISIVNAQGDSLLSTTATNVDIENLSIAGSRANKGINLPNAKTILLNSITINGNTISNAVVSVGGTVDTMTMTSCVIQSNGGVGVSVAATSINQLTLNGNTISNQSTAISLSSSSINTITLNNLQAKQNMNGAVKITAKTIGSISINNGDISSNSVTNGDGAGLYVSATTSVGQLDIESTTMSGNQGNYGAGISITSPSIGPITGSNNRFINNMANNGGGAINVKSSGSISLDVQGTTFQNNQAKSQPGGAISLQSTSSGNLTFHADGCLFDQNRAQSSGGAIYASSLFGSLGTFNFSSSNLTGNSAGTGGAVRLESFGLFSELSVVGGVATNNYATSGPGGVFSVSTNGIDVVTMSDVTYANNYGNTGGAVSLISQGSIQQMSVVGLTGQNNSATQGGCMEIASQGTVSLSITSSQFESNNGTQYGGSVYLSAKVGGSVSSVGTNYNSNVGGNGGALYVDSYMDVQISGGVFSNNQATRGGSICGASVKSLRVDGQTTTFQNNVGVEGGAIYAKTTNTAQLRAITITASVFDSNRATVGGALLLIAGDQSLSTPLSQRKRDLTAQVIVISVTQSVLQGNSASVGGALALYGPSELNSLSFSGGSSQYGGAFALLGSSVATLNSNSYGENSIYLSNGTYLITSSVVGLIVNCTKGKLELKNNYAYCPEDNSTVANAIDNITPSTVPASTVPSSSNGVPFWVIIIAVVGGVALIALIVGIIIFVRSKSKRGADEESTSVQLKNLTGNNVIYYKDLEKMVQIGRGAFGVVFRAEWREIIVAVKQLKDMATIEQAQLEEFTREVALLQGLKHHPNVVMFIGISVTPDPVSLVTEFCSGGNLLEFCINHKKDIPLENKIKFILGIASGMHHLHHENIIHRDLAARNVLLSSSFEPKISDFGLSRKTESADDASMTTSNVGPLKWMAPEAIVRKEYSAKSDVFSFAMTVWEILSEGNELYPGLSPVNAAIAVTTQGARPDITEEMHKSAPRIVSIMQMCWETEPEKRPTFKGICRWLKEDAPLTQPVEVVEEEDRKDDAPVYSTINARDHYAPTSSIPHATPKKVEE
ncbi:hypothetical protein PROFUN_12630 [Planoprotostelium fungivorum]|uniref:Protein kinase domain-containing protein n=1 Tax=Planoprotostelium fungivorum TaxID=1890364 RepID=A0A2P6N742_9EUKA|nr:hypothetical protein PROFUN_12630 [Planoprotostelium fungivorum]